MSAAWRRVKATFDADSQYVCLSPLVLLTDDDLLSDRAAKVRADDSVALLLLFLIRRQGRPQYCLAAVELPTSRPVVEWGD